MQLIGLLTSWVISMYITPIKPLLKLIYKKIFKHVETEEFVISLVLYTEKNFTELRTVLIVSDDITSSLRETLV